uniref:Chitin-binding type-2 domain-containing protein n=1 Tax=Photinus pyralis TaxID=7054 RepID=A0A1Y1LLB0_PHOPY
MKCANLVFILILGGTWRLGHPTCVLESEFGFILNCAFKKSGLFRVRNLGGVKAHIGLGFSLGDELGFKESLTNVEAEGNRRRSVPGASKFQSINPSPQINAKNLVIRPIPSMTSADGSTIPPFKPIPPAPERVPITKNSTRRIGSIVPTPTFVGVVPAFNAIPTSISRVSTGGIIPVDSNKLSQTGDKLSSTNLAIRTLASPLNNEIFPTVPNNAKSSIQALAAATNISSEAIEAALLIRQQQLAAKKATITTTHKPPPTPPRHLSSRNKVMNAPKEYYPVGYDKNFDDNFASRVDLPDTSFYCGDQKHFPGLYADEDLGCMVFHVCALTDDGLIMKSFLCPESTLFDQTILKCNWWFYVECKNSKKLYDSNIPVSKSYQLMKALTFFSSYKNDTRIPKSNLKD